MAAFVAPVVPVTALASVHAASHALPMVSFSDRHTRFLATNSYASTHTIHHAAVHLNCVNNDCPTSGAPLIDQGGPLVTTPKVYFVLFSNSAASLSPSNYVPGVTSNTEPSAAGATNATLNSPYATAWQTEYSRYAKAQLLHPGAYAGTITLDVPSIANASSVDDNQISNALILAAQNGQLGTVTANDIFVTFFHSGQEVTVNSSGLNSISSFCAYHTSSTAYVNGLSVPVNYAVMPDEAANAGCWYTSPTASQLDNLTPILAHELTEAVTDPTSPSAWINPSSSQEIGDICEAGATVVTPVTSLTGFTYNLQYFYSNIAAACVGPRSFTNLTVTAAGTTTSSVTAHLLAPPASIPNATLYLIGASGVLATATTSSSGIATFTIAPTTTNTLTVLYQGSSTYSGALASPGTAPGAPTITNVRAPSFGATVTYQAPASSGDAPVGEYLTTLSPGGETCVVDQLSCTFTGLSNGTTYTATTYALNAAGISGPSSTTTFIPAPGPAWPTNVVVVPGPSKLIVSWTASTTPGVLSYVATASPGGQSCTYVVSSPESDTCTITGLANGTTYQVGVVAQNASGVSDPYGASGTPANTPSAPTNVTASTSSSSSATISWSAPSDNGGSAVTSYVTTSSPGSLTCVSATTSCSFTGLTNGTAYTFTVQAANAVGLSTPSSASNTVTPLGPPSAPLGVVLVSAPGQLTVNWSVPANNGGSPTTGYQATASPGSFNCTSAGAATCTITGLTNGTAYTISVQATNAKGFGPAATAGPATPGSVPTAPTNLTAIPTNGAATVTWSAPSDNGGVPVTSYVVTASPGGASCTSATTSCTVPGLTNAQSYTFNVVAVNAVGTSPASSPSAPVTPMGPPSAPQSLTLTPSSGAIAVTWTAPANNGGSAVTGYVVTASPGSVTCTVTATSCTLSGLTNATTYQVSVVVVNALGTSPATSATATPAGAPTAPTNVAASPGPSSATVTWSAPSNNGGSAIVGYTVYSSPDRHSCTTATTSCVVTGLVNGVSYNFTVVAFNAVASSSPSTPSSSITPASAPSSPQSPRATTGNTSATISWQAPVTSNGSAITAYRVTAQPGGATCITATTSCVLTGLTNATTYQVAVVAVNAAGSSTPATTVVTPVNLSLSVSVPSTVLYGANVPVTVTLSPAQSNKTVTLISGTNLLTATTNPLGRAVFQFTATQATTNLMVSSGGVSASATLAVVYGFGGFQKSSLSLGSSTVRFVLRDANGPLSASRVLELANFDNVTLVVSKAGKVLSRSRCGAAGGYFSCAYKVTTAKVTLQVVVTTNQGPFVPLTVITGAPATIGVGTR